MTTGSFSAVFVRKTISWPSSFFSPRAGAEEITLGVGDDLPDDPVERHLGVGDDEAVHLLVVGHLPGRLQADRERGGGLRVESDQFERPVDQLLPALHLLDLGLVDGRRETCDPRPALVEVQPEPIGRSSGRSSRGRASPAGRWRSWGPRARRPGSAAFGAGFPFSSTLLLRRLGDSSDRRPSSRRPSSRRPCPGPCPSPCRRRRRRLSSSRRRGEGAGGRDRGGRSARSSPTW